MIPIFTNILSPDEFSNIGSFAVVYTLLVLLYGLNLSASIIIIKHEDKDKFESALISNLMAVYLWMIALSGIIYIYRFELAILLGVDMETLLLAAGSAFFSVLLFNVLAVYQSLEKSIIYSSLSIAKSLITFS